MSYTLAPFGLRVAAHQSCLVRPKCYRNAIPSGYATTLYKGAPIALNTSGQIVIAANGADWLGMFIGVEFRDASGRPNVMNYWPANQTLLANSEMSVYVVDDPETIYEIQCEGSVAQAAIFDQANFSVAGGRAVGDGSTMTGLSSCAVSATLAGAGVQGMLRVIDKALYSDNDWGDSYTTILAKVARHQGVSAKVAV